MFFNKDQIPRSRERETELQFNDNIDRLDPNDLCWEPTLAAEKSQSDGLASEILSRIYQISVNIALPPCAIRSHPTLSSSVHLTEYALAFSQFELVVMFLATAYDTLPESCADICRPCQGCTSSQMETSPRLSYCSTATGFNTAMIGLPAVCHDEVQNVGRQTYSLFLRLHVSRPKGFVGIDSTATMPG
jgi:hypothetical protein